MVESCVESARVYQVCHRKLANATETLKYGCFNDVRFVPGQTDETVNWVSYSSLFAHCSKHFMQSTFAQYARFREGRTQDEIRLGATPEAHEEVESRSKRESGISWLHSLQDLGRWCGNLLTSGLFVLKVSEFGTEAFWRGPDSSQAV